MVYITKSQLKHCNIRQNFNQVFLRRNFPFTPISAVFHTFYSLFHVSFWCSDKAKKVENGIKFSMRLAKFCLKMFPVKLFHLNFLPYSVFHVKQGPHKFGLICQQGCQNVQKYVDNSLENLQF